MNCTPGGSFRRCAGRAAGSGRGGQPRDAGRLRADRGGDGEAVRGLGRAGPALRQRAPEVNYMATLTFKN